MNLRGRNNTPAAPPAQVEPFEALRERLQEQESHLHQLQREQAASSGRLGDLLAEKATGGVVDVDELARLLNERESLNSRIEETTLTVDAMRARVDKLAADHDAQTAATLAAEIAECSAKGKQHEQQFAAALTAVSDILEAMHENKHRYDVLGVEYRKHSNTGHGFDRVRSPFVIPERVFKSAPGRGQLTLAELANQWLTEPARMAERSKRNAENEARKAAEAADKESARQAKIARIQAQYDAAPMPV